MSAGERQSGVGWATCAIEVAVIVCIVSVDRAASALVDRWGRGAAGEEVVGKASAIDAWMLKQAYAQAKLLERITGLRAVPLLVFSNAYLTPAVTRRDGVVILTSRMLVKHLLERGGTIPPERVDDVYRRLAAALPG